MTDFLTADTNLPSYMMFPRFLLDMEINENATMLYIILLDRARLSQKNEGWSDTDGHAVSYTHLDVYKRQSCNDISFSPFCVVSLFQAQDYTTLLEAVSYTHLFGKVFRFVQAAVSIMAK